LTYSQVETKLSGKIIDDKLTSLFGVKITDLNNGAESITDQNGQFEINVSQNDTLEFSFIGLTSEKIKIETINENLNLIMIDKSVNCLGAIWTDKMYERAEKKQNRMIKKLYKKAEKNNVWKK